MLRETSSCPGATKEAISRYPMPEHLADRSKYAALTYYQLGAQSNPLRDNCQSVLKGNALLLFLDWEGLRGAKPKAWKLAGHP